MIFWHLINEDMLNMQCIFRLQIWLHLRINLESF